MGLLDDEAFSCITGYLDEIDTSLNEILDKQLFERDLIPPIQTITRAVGFTRDNLILRNRENDNMHKTLVAIYDEIKPTFIQELPAWEHKPYIERARVHLEEARKFFEERKGRVV